MDGHGRRASLLGWLGRALSENIGLKVTSLLIALALFGLVRGAGNVQRSIEVSLLARLPPASARRVLMSDLPDKLRLTLRGSPSLVGAIRPDELGPVQIDLSDGRRAAFYFDPSLVQMPAGVTLAQIQPSSLPLAWENLIERSVPVRPDITGTPAEGAHVVGLAESSPTQIGVSGPELYVVPIVAVRTDAIDVTGLGPGTYERRVALALDPRPHVQYDANSGVRVAFRVEREVAQRVIEHVAVTTTGVGRVELHPPLVRVVVSGSPAAVNGILAAELVPTVDLGDGSALHTAGRAPQPVSARLPVAPPTLPPGVTLVSIEPTEVIVVPEHPAAARPGVYPPTPP